MAKKFRVKMRDEDGTWYKIEGGWCQPGDPQGDPLEWDTREEAEEHAVAARALRDEYGQEGSIRVAEVEG